MQTLLYGAAALHRFVPAERSESVGANDLGADAVEFRRKRRVCSALLKIDDDHGLGGVLRTRAHADAEDGVVEHESIGMPPFGRHGSRKAGLCRDTCRCRRACERWSSGGGTDKAYAQGRGDVGDAVPNGGGAAASEQQGDGLYRVGGHDQ